MVVLGRVLGAYGVAGWVRIDAYSEAPDALLDYAPWHVRRSQGGTWREVQPRGGRMQGSHLVAQIEGIESREDAQALRGSEIGVPRSELPEAADDEVYWADLVGLEVVNREGRSLGRVQGVTEHGAHPLLQVKAEQGGRERLIPCVPAVIDAIDVPGGRIEVDWGEDY